MNIIQKHKDTIKQAGWMLVFMQCTALCIALMRGDSLWVTPLYLFEAAYYHWTLTFLLSITTVGFIAIAVGLSMQKGAKHFYGLFLMLVLACVGVSLSISLWLLAQYLEFSRIPVIWHIPWLYQALAAQNLLVSFYQFVLGGLAVGLIIPIIAVIPWDVIKATQTPAGHAYFASLSECIYKKLFTTKGIVLGTMNGQALRLGGYESALVLAPMGSGKTTAIAIPNLIEWQGSMILNDLKGELFKETANFRKDKLHQKVYNFVPASNDIESDGFNPFYYVSDNENLRIRDLQRIAEIIIPADRVDGGFWCNSSREIFIMLALYLFETKKWQL